MTEWIPHGTEAWYAARVGKLTSSRVEEAIARNKSDTAWLASRGHYMAELVAEQLSGKAAPSPFKSADMRWGNEQEPEAIRAYQFRHDVEVEPGGYLDHPRIPKTGASPDGRVGDIGLVEIKCPRTSTFIQYLKAGVIPEEYLPQMRWQLACTGRAWCDFVAFDPRLPAPMHLLVRRLHRDEADIPKIETMASDFMAEVEQTSAWLRKNYGDPRKAA